MKWLKRQWAIFRFFMWDVHVLGYLQEFLGFDETYKNERDNRCLSRTKDL